MRSQETKCLLAGTSEMVEPAIPCIVNVWQHYYLTVQSVKNAAVLTEDRAFALSFVPTPGDLTAQESPPPGICHPRQKKC